MTTLKIELPKNQLTFHPLAIKYGGNLGKKELDALAKDIAENGQRFPIVVHNGQIIEGVQRYRACLQIKTEPLITPYDVKRHGDTEADIAAFIISANIHRRHLTPKQKREIIAGYLKANPAASNRVIAEKVGSDKNTVSKARKEMEATGEIHQLKKTTGKDGKQRKQPTKLSQKSQPKAADGVSQPRLQSKSAPAPSTRILEAWRDATPEERSAFVKQIGLSNLYMLAPPVQKDKLADAIRNIGAKTGGAAIAADTATVPS
jgi:hypothetical protein